MQGTVGVLTVRKKSKNSKKEIEVPNSINRAMWRHAMYVRCTRKGTNAEGLPTEERFKGTACEMYESKSSMSLQSYRKERGRGVWKSRVRVGLLLLHVDIRRRLSAKLASSPVLPDGERSMGIKRE